MYRQTGFKLTEIYLSPFHKTPGLKFFCHCAQTYDPLFIEGTGSRWEDELYGVSVDRGGDKWRSYCTSSTKRWRWLGYSHGIGKIAKFRLHLGARILGMKKQSNSN